MMGRIPEINLYEEVEIELLKLIKIIYGRKAIKLTDFANIVGKSASTLYRWRDEGKLKELLKWNGITYIPVDQTVVVGIIRD